MTEQDYHIIALCLSILFGGLAAYRIHCSELFESGMMLRIGIFLLAVWRGFGDLHEVTNWFDWWEILYSHGLRNIVSEIILTIALLADIWRFYERQQMALNTQRLVQSVKDEREGL